jgi:2-amino-5-formylamino-6-ribosylaminopyrimidin-4(3H)-one 5'-monophosphate deformylase
MLGHEVVSKPGDEKMLSTKVGVMALGSHREKHGAALPPDTDAKLASHVAEEAAKMSGAKFIGILYSSYELPGIDTGVHQPMDEVIEELTTALSNAKRMLGITGAVLVNGHGGNNPLMEKIPELEKKIGLRIFFNNTLVDMEGAHAATGELSMGLMLGITKLSKLMEHNDFVQYPEVGFVGLAEARKKYPWADELAKLVMRFGIRVSPYLGMKLLECTIIDVINSIREM